MSDYVCSVCDLQAEYMINFNFHSLEDGEITNKVGWYCWRHASSTLDDFAKQCVEIIGNDVGDKNNER